jgi:plastocyanin
MTIRGLALAVAAGAVFAIAGCGPQSTPGPVVTAEPNSPTISSKDLKFDRTELEVPAGRAFTLVYDNLESAVHNVAIYTDQNATTELYKGELFSGPATRVYLVPALAAGTYYFRCDVHLQMFGSVVAKAP